MPTCYRCERENLPTAEVRRTSRGYLCKDNGVGTRCWKIAREIRAAARRRRILGMPPTTGRAERSAA